MSDLTSLAAAATASAALNTPPQPTTSPAPPTNSVRGSLIVLEGLDRSGKTTQVKLLEQRFVEAGRAVKVQRFPNRNTATGKMIDQYLQQQVELDDHVIHLLFSANRWEAAQSIQNLLAAGTTVICDRYYLSGMVYSTAKQNPSLSLQWARNPEIGLPRPDMVLFLDIDEETARSRGGWGGEVYEKAAIQKRVRELFWDLSMGKKGEYRQEEEDLVVVEVGPSKNGVAAEASEAPSKEEVSEEIWRKVSDRVAAVDRGEVGKTVRIVS